MFNRPQLPASGTRPRRPRRPRLMARRAFTLLELLVAAVITAVLAGFIVVIVSNVSGFWTRTAGKLSTEAQARLVLDQLTLDLSSAHYRDDGNVWMAATVLGNTSNSNLWDVRGATAALLKPATAPPGTGLSYNSAAGIASDSFGQAGVWLRYFTTKRGSNLTATTISAPVAVGWQIVRRLSSANTAGADRRYFLHRAESRPAANGPRLGVLEYGFDLTLPAYSANSAPAATNNGSQADDPYAVRSPQSLATMVGENVIDFGVRLHVRDLASPGSLTRIFPTNGRDTTHLASKPPNIGAAATQFPEVVDVMVRILTDEGARLIFALETGKLGVTPPTGLTLQGWWWQIAIANSQVFTRRIVLPSKPL
jgi:prepilin-type N-terminal cleavage/methylation domain-containing protein